MASFAFGSVRTTYAKKKQDATPAGVAVEAQPSPLARQLALTALEGSRPETLADAPERTMRTTMRDPFAPSLDNPLMCSPTARAFAEQQRAKALQLPTRFVQPSLNKFEAKKQHPAYSTSSHEHGSRKPTVTEMPSAYYSVDSSFSATFGGSQYRNMSLATGKAPRPVGQ